MAPDNDSPQREARVTRLLHDAAQTQRAPASLRAAVEGLRTQRAQDRGRRLLSTPVRLTGAAGSSVAVLLIVLALVLSGGPTTPSIAAAAALGARGPTMPAPSPDPHAPSTLLNARVGDLQFPNWERRGGWRSTGQRTDKLGDRTVRTVYYASGRLELAYSIVSAPALGAVNTHGQPYATSLHGARVTVVWTARNHTCILSAARVAPSVLWRLASSTL